MDNTKTLYPVIPTAPEIEDCRENYRYKRVMNIEQELSGEIKAYKASLKKYKIILKYVHFIIFISSIVGMITGITGFANIMSIQIHNILSVVGGIGCMILTCFSYKVSAEVKKHIKKLTLAQNTRYMLENIISDALKNGNISDVEFQHITECIQKYRNAKAKRTMRGLKEDLEEEKNKAFQKGREVGKGEIKANIKKIVV